MRSDVYFKAEKKVLFDAMWQWVLDHSELTNDGMLFVKAHVHDKKSFARSIMFRVKGNYRTQIKDEQIQILKEQQTNRTELGKAIKEAQKINRERVSKRKWYLKILEMYNKLVK